MGVDDLLVEGIVLADGGKQRFDSLEFLCSTLMCPCFV
jgi:hypothetical protein